VVVSDGFVGNILLKSIEAASSVMGKLIREEIKCMIPFQKSADCSLGTLF